MLPKILPYLLIATFLLNRLTAVYAIENTNIQNNKFGIHLAQPSEEDIEKADSLVNSNGGSWGYITLVIHEDDKDVQKWQNTFDKLREKKLIPIIRLATKPIGNNWDRPDKEDAEEWLKFLNSLHWVVKNRYIILFNEPNHATEWGGEVDPQNFAEVVKNFAEIFKNSKEPYFIMMGGLDLSAPSQKPRYEDAEVFYKIVVHEIGVEDFNMLFDGLSSHSYPNPAFSGSPFNYGRKSVRGYEWELSLLKSLGIKKLPVFITETGWDGDVISRFKIADYFTYAYRNVWLPDDRVFAVTPFILNYQSEPFLKFSWIKKDSNEPHPEFLKIQTLPKKSGRPEIEEKGEVLFNFPKAVVENSTYNFKLEIINSGQGIWNDKNNYALKVESEPTIENIVGNLGEVRPFERRIVDVFLKTGLPSENSKIRIIILRDGKEVISSKIHHFETVSLPELGVKVSLFPWGKEKDSSFELQIFDKDEVLVFRKNDLKIKNGVGKVDKIENIALDTRYRVVILKNGYLPRQVFVNFKKNSNLAHFETMLPLDPSGDGALNMKDLVFLINKPFEMLF